MAHWSYSYNILENIVDMQQSKHASNITISEVPQSQHIYKSQMKSCNINMGINVNISSRTLRWVMHNIR